jgi:hypothetical protein
LLILKGLMISPFKAECEDEFGAYVLFFRQQREPINSELFWVSSYLDHNANITPYFTSMAQQSKLTQLGGKAVRKFWVLLQMYLLEGHSAYASVLSIEFLGPQKLYFKVKQEAFQELTETVWDKIRYGLVEYPLLLPPWIETSVNTKTGMLTIKLSP